EHPPEPYWPTRKVLLSFESESCYFAKLWWRLIGLLREVSTATGAISPQPQHDFGLRALEAVLASAGILKRGHLLKAREQADADDAAVGVSDVISEKIISIQSVTETVVPMLVADDVVPSAPCFPSLLADIFSNMSVDLDFSRGGIYIIRKERKLVTGEH
ncbi:hypothetical protein F5880DRAFT_1507554, partial [Lentinula raphanica]